jgi:glycosyltransferase involved in cell wall biosynthesis
VRITGWVDRTTFEHYLAAADVGVQLRTSSRGETSAAVLDCMNYGLATIVNAHGALADLDDDGVFKLPDDFSDGQLIRALEILRTDAGLLQRLGIRAREIILARHSPTECAARYHEAIERFSELSWNGAPALVSAIADLGGTISEPELSKIAAAASLNAMRGFSNRQLLVDVSELVQRDAKTGIQRVVRSVLREWLINSPPGVRIEPVYSEGDGYRYARRFTLDFLNCPSNVLDDEPLDFRAGDIFVGLDLNLKDVAAHQAFYQRLRAFGLQVYFIVYDLLCVRTPQHFIAGAADLFTAWLRVVAECDGAICISRAVADDLGAWLEINGPKRERPFRIEWFHLGADIENTVPTFGLPDNGSEVLAALGARPSFLMVGTVEARKGHAQTLAALELCWREGQDISLVIVGKPGWLVDELIKKIRSHPELGKRLFWLEGISDEYLEKIYAASACLIAASEAEGFGLPLIEAAQHKLSIIARDIPVFREVAGQHALYFTGNQPQALAAAITRWLVLYYERRHPKSDAMPWNTWKQSVERLNDILLNDSNCASGNSVSEPTNIASR